MGKAQRSRRNGVLRLMGTAALAPPCAPRHLDYPVQRRVAPLPVLQNFLCFTISPGAITLHTGFSTGYFFEEVSRMSEHKEYMCVVCGFVYNEAAGLPEEGFAPGTRWADIPDSWVCPECGAAKDDFEMVEV